MGAALHTADTCDVHGTSPCRACGVPTMGDMLSAMQSHYGGDVDVMNAHISNEWGDMGFKGTRGEAAQRLYNRVCEKQET